MSPFVAVVLALAALIGVGAAMVVRRGLRRRSEVRALALGVGTFAAGLVASWVLVAAWVGIDGFALVHVTYAAFVVGAPLGAAVVLVSTRGASLGLRATLGVVLLLAPLGMYATFVEPFWLRVDRAEVPVGDADADPLRIGVLADLQTPRVGDYEEDAVDTLLAEDPDLVLIPGDVWQTTDGELGGHTDEFRALMSRIDSAVPHVFVVDGDSDHLQGLLDITAGTDIEVLNNTMEDVVIEGTPVRILGVGRYGSPTQFERARRQLFAEERGDGDPLRIVVAHAPDEIDRFSPDDDLDLLVAGHTHGGQISLPLVGPPITFSNVPRSIAAGGLHRLDGHFVYVSTGVGHEHARAPQVRFGARPSVGVLDIVPR